METLKDARDSKKWGLIKSSVPKYARFKLFVQYYKGAASYFSYDYVKKFNNGIETKVKNEYIGLMKLIELCCSLNEKKEREYRYANIFCNITSDLDTTKKNYDYLVCSFSPSAGIKWKKKLFWIDEIFPLYTKIYLNVKKTEEFNRQLLQFNEFMTDDYRKASLH